MAYQLILSHFVRIVNFNSIHRVFLLFVSSLFLRPGPKFLSKPTHPKIWRVLIIFIITGRQDFFWFEFDLFILWSLILDRLVLPLLNLLSQFLLTWDCPLDYFQRLNLRDLGYLMWLSRIEIRMTLTSILGNVNILGNDWLLPLVEFLSRWILAGCDLFKSPNIKRVHIWWRCSFLFKLRLYLYLVFCLV